LLAAWQPSTVGLVGRLLAPVWLADQHHAAGPQAVPEELDRAGYAAADPGGADTRGDAGRLAGDMARRVAVHEADLVIDAPVRLVPGSAK